MSQPNASHAAAIARTFSVRMAASLMEMSECKSAIKKNDSLPGLFDSSMAGIIAPNKLPKCGLPLLCMPVKILAIVLQIK